MAPRGLREGAGKKFFSTEAPGVRHWLSTEGDYENRIVPDIPLRRGVYVRLRACRVSAGSAVAGRR